MLCCEEARKLSGDLRVEYDQLVTEPREAFKKKVEAEFGDEPVSVSYHPPEEHRPRIGAIVALRRRIDEGWCPVHTVVH